MRQLEAWSSFALALIGVIALAVAWFQATEARNLRRSTTRAYVVIDVEGDDPSNPAINLFISNVGQSHAENVSVRFDPPLEAASSSVDLEATEAIWHQTLMAPGRRINNVLDDARDRKKSDLPMRFRAEVRWDSPATEERGITGVYDIDLNASLYAVRKWRHVDHDTPKQTRALESIAASLKAIVAGREAS